MSIFTTAEVRLGHRELEAERVGLVDRRDLGRRADVLADVDEALADDAVERRADARVAEELRGGLLLRLRGRGRPLLRRAVGGLPVVFGLRDRVRLEQVLHALALALRLLRAGSAATFDCASAAVAPSAAPRASSVASTCPRLTSLPALDERLHDLAGRVSSDVRLLVAAERAGERHVLRHRRGSDRLRVHVDRCSGLRCRRAGPCRTTRDKCTSRDKDEAPPDSHVAPFGRHRSRNRQAVCC